MFGAYFSTKLGYRVEGDDKVSLPHEEVRQQHIKERQAFLL